jgi:hypothetical protein
VASPPDDEVFLDERWLSIVWDRRRRCVRAQFRGFATSSEFRSGTMKILDVIRAKRVDLLISDNRSLEGVTPADRLWIRDSWIPKAVAAGLKRIAVVVARQGLGKLASEEIISQSVGRVFATRTFDSIEAAKEWIAS